MCGWKPKRTSKTKSKNSSKALPLVEAETGTKAWFAIKMGPMTYGIFDVFLDDGARNAHLSGKVPGALMARAEELFRLPPKIEKVDVVAAKLR
jgi:hypothetical protein